MAKDTVKGRVETFWGAEKAARDFQEARTTFSEKLTKFDEAKVQVDAFRARYQEMEQIAKTEKEKPSPDKAVLDALEAEYKKRVEDVSPHASVVRFVNKWKPYVEHAEGAEKGLEMYQQWVAGKRQVALDALDKQKIPAKGDAAVVIGGKWCGHTKKHIEDLNGTVLPEYDGKLKLNVLYNTDEKQQPIAGAYELAAALTTEGGVPQTLLIKNGQIVADPLNKEDNSLFPKGKLPIGEIRATTMFPLLAENSQLFLKPGSAYYRQAEYIQELRSLIPAKEEPRDRSVSAFVNGANKATSDAYLSTSEMASLREAHQKYRAGYVPPEEPRELNRTAFGEVLGTIEKQLANMTERRNGQLGLQ